MVSVDLPLRCAMNVGVRIRLLVVAKVIRHRGVELKMRVEANSLLAQEISNDLSYTH
jgi:hypothetical protein